MMAVQEIALMMVRIGWRTWEITRNGMRMTLDTNGGFND